MTCKSKHITCRGLFDSNVAGTGITPLVCPCGAPIKHHEHKKQLFQMSYMNNNTHETVMEEERAKWYTWTRCSGYMSTSTRWNDNARRTKPVQATEGMRFECCHRVKIGDLVYPNGLDYVCAACVECIEAHKDCPCALCHGGDLNAICEKTYCSSCMKKTDDPDRYFALVDGKRLCRECYPKHFGYTEVQYWLMQNGQSAQFPLFEKHEIGTLDILKQLTVEDLRYMQVPLGPMKAIQSSITATVDADKMNKQLDVVSKTKHGFERGQGMDVKRILEHMRLTYEQPLFDAARIETVKDLHNLTGMHPNTNPISEIINVASRKLHAQR